MATTAWNGDHMADANSSDGRKGHTRVTSAIYVRFVPLGDVEAIEATISRQTACELAEQLERQLRPEPVADDGQPTA